MSNTTDATPPAANPAVQIKDKALSWADAALIHKRINEQQVQLALALSTVYEFVVKDLAAGPRLYKARPELPHSWVAENLGASVRSSMPLDLTLIKPYQLGPTAKFDVPLPMGLTAVFGRSGAGKTRLVFDRLFMACATNDPGSVAYMRVFEPSDPERDRRAIDLLGPAGAAAILEFDFEFEVAVNLARALLDPKVEVIIVDSLRYLFYESSGGATGKGGVNMGLFMSLTHLDKVARSCGKRLVVVINPMTDDDIAFNFYVEAAVGAAAAVVVCDSPVTGRHTQRYGSSRDFGSLAFTASTVLDAPKGQGKRGTAQHTNAQPHLMPQPAVVSGPIFGTGFGAANFSNKP